MSNRKGLVHTPAGGPIHVRVAPETLYNIEALQAVQRAVLGRLGCPTCCSGLPILFQGLEQEFEVAG